MNKDSLPAKIKDFLFSVIVLIFMFLLTVFFLVPKIQQIFSLRSESLKQLEKINQLSQKLADLQTLSEAELYDSANFLIEALPANKDFYKVLMVVKKTAADNGLTIESFKISPGIVSTASASVSDTGDLKFNLTFTTTFSGLKNFLDSLEKTLPIFSVENLKLTSPVSTVSASLLVQGTMEVRSPARPLPKNLGGIEKPLVKISNKDRLLIEELKSYNRFQIEVSAEEAAESVIIGKENPF